MPLYLKFGKNSVTIEKKSAIVSAVMPQADPPSAENELNRIKIKREGFLSRFQ